MAQETTKKRLGSFTLLDLRRLSFRRDHANILRIVPSLTFDPRRQSETLGSFERRRQLARRSNLQHSRLHSQTKTIEIDCTKKTKSSSLDLPAGRLRRPAKARNLEITKTRFPKKHKTKHKQRTHFALPAGRLLRRPPGPPSCRRP